MDCEEVQELKERKTQELNDQLLAEFDEKTVEELMSVQLEGILKRHQSLVLEILESEANINVKRHKQWLSEVQDVDKHFDRMIEMNTPEPSEAPSRIIDFMNQVCKAISRNNGVYACKIVVVGSHYDGTKMFSYDEIDILLLLKHKPNIDYNVKAKTGLIPKYCIEPVEGSYFYKCCLEEELLVGKQLAVHEYRERFIELLKSVLSKHIITTNLYFGGWNRPHFGDFVWNNPALTFVMNGISVDITVAFSVPESEMENVKKGIPWAFQSVDQFEEEWGDQYSHLRSTIRNKQWLVHWNVLAKALPEYTSLGLLIPTSEDSCELSSSLIEARLFKSNAVLQKLHKVGKVYRHVFFNLPYPNIIRFYRRLEDRVFAWILDKLQQGMGSETEALKKVVNEADGESLCLLLLATKQRPLTTKLEILKQLEEIHQRCCEKFHNVLLLHLLDPCLENLLGQGCKPMIRTKSFVFKCLILEEWLQSKGVAEATTMMKNVLERYQQQLQEESQYAITHPLLFEHKLEALIPHGLCHDFINEVKKIHCNAVNQIIAQVCL